MNSDSSGSTSIVIIWSRDCLCVEVVKNQKKPSKPGVSTSARDSPVSKPMKADPPQMLQPFRRPEAIKVED